MNIETARTEKDKLEAIILHLVNNFNKMTGLSVKGIVLVNQVHEPLKSHKYTATVKVEARIELE